MTTAHLKHLPVSVLRKFVRKGRGWALRDGESPVAVAAALLAAVQARPQGLTDRQFLDTNYDTVVAMTEKKRRPP